MIISVRIQKRRELSVRPNIFQTSNMQKKRKTLQDRGIEHLSQHLRSSISVWCWNLLASILSVKRQNTESEWDYIMADFGKRWWRGSVEWWHTMSSALFMRSDAGGLLLRSFCTSTLISHTITIVRVRRDESLLWGATRKLWNLFAQFSGAFFRAPRTQNFPNLTSCRSLYLLLEVQ